MSVKAVSETAVGIYQSPAYGEPGRHFVIVNNDKANPVYYSDSIGTIDAQSSQIQPLETVAFDGTQDVWLSTLESSISVYVDVRFGVETYTAGYLPNALSNTLLTLSSFAISANSSVTAGNAIIDTIAFPAYDMQIAAWCESQATTGAALTMHCTLQWFSDEAATQLVWQEESDIWLSSVSSAISPAYATGINHGRYFKLILTNPGNTTIQDTFVVMHGSPRASSDTTSTWKQIPPYSNITSGIKMFPTPPVTAIAGLLSTIFNVEVAAGNTMWQPLPLWRGRVTGVFKTSQVLESYPHLYIASDLLTGDITGGVGSPYPILELPNTAGAETAFDLELPNMPAYIVIQTTSTNSSYIFLTMTSSS